MKKLINKPEDVVRECMAGMAAAHRDLLRVHYDPHYICRAEAPLEGQVALVSGGGSGHEPMHGGFVGRGMLAAACPGEIFTSPTPDQMLEAAKAVNGGAGVLFVVKNYSGDVMNFEMAAEWAHAEGIPVACVLVDDDVAVRDSLYTQGRRGVGTTVLLEKIGGAAAEAGYGLKDLTDLTRRVNRNGRSIGVALTPCITPAKGSPTFELGADEMEFGIGIHGEPGRERMRVQSADEIAVLMTEALLTDGAYSRTLRDWDPAQSAWVDVEYTDPPFEAGDNLLAFVNGMGGTPDSELYILYRKVAETCEQKGFPIVRNLVGSYITSLEMQGCSITLLKMDDEMIRLWDAPVLTPALRWGV